MTPSNEKDEVEEVVRILEESENEGDSDIEDGVVIDRDGEEVTLDNEGLKE